MMAPLHILCANRRLAIGDGQQQRLAKVVDTQQVTIWAVGTSVPDCATLLIDEPPGAWQVDDLYHSLSPRISVIIPRSENPHFDFLKSKLRCHGTIGATAPDSPHQIWWGGTGTRHADNFLDIVQQSHVVTCIDCDKQDRIQCRRVRPGPRCTQHNPCHQPHRRRSLNEDPGYRSRLLLEAWERTDKALIWLDPSGGPDLSTITLNLKHADFAAIPTAGGLFSTSLLYFARSGP